MIYVVHTLVAHSLTIMLTQPYFRRFFSSITNCLDFTLGSALSTTRSNLHILKVGSHKLNDLYPKTIYNRTHLLLENCSILPGIVKAQSIEDISCSPRDDLRKEQFTRIIGKIGIKKRDAGPYWKRYKEKRIKIRKRKRVI
ncbi:hypothetical protein BEWA_033270 [Theileria equi strain WA]|uniref:Uncharacterized protein n=1 Tax=Theileria equi strain WA TaxID=1537102 RepID=L0B026_THEEQ|nr:hypothetical protein BEWA_033270 [Theileria equi strain WA]AFZ80474.1 hypothetical protein BEWA_033270 [Theileria equi strain WA]|eukprot:XP_004830140.1 hypothetical protein BEWA_033270 [Theileria equi strain WA]